MARGLQLIADPGYVLGIDVGTTFTAAATIDESGVPTMVGLGDRALQVPSVLYLQSNGPALVGEAAERRGRHDSNGLAREFKRRFADPVPFMVGSRPITASALTGLMIEWVVGKVTERVGAPPRALTLTYPANWGPYRVEKLEELGTVPSIPLVITCSEPQAAAIHYAARTSVPVGATIAIYDLGGGSFDICVLRKSNDGFEILGEPSGIEQLGGIDLDELVFRHVMDTSGIVIDELNVDNADTTAELRALRNECVEAKETLSADVEASIGVNVSQHRRLVRMTRPELEDLIQPALERTISATDSALRAADIDPTELWCLLLVGGSSRIPLVTELLTRTFRCRISLDTHPKHIVALGSARVASIKSSMPARSIAAESFADAVGPEKIDLAGDQAADGQPRRMNRRRWLLVGPLTILLVAGAIGAWFFFNRSTANVVEHVVTVDSKSDWSDTGIRVDPSTVVRLTSSGEFADDQTRPNQLFTPDGADRDPVKDVHNLDPYLQFPHAGLIGRIGADGDPFYIGRALRIIEPSAGNLYLTVNDSVYTDNLGTLEVRVDIESR